MKNFICSTLLFLLIGANPINANETKELEAEILSATSFGEAFGEMLMDMKSEIDDEPMNCGSITKEDKYNNTDCPQTCGTFFECRMETLKFEYEMQQEQQHLYHQRMNELNN